MDDYLGTLVTFGDEETSRQEALRGFSKLQLYAIAQFKCPRGLTYLPLSLQHLSMPSKPLALSNKSGYGCPLIPHSSVITGLHTQC